MEDWKQRGWAIAFYSDGSPRIEQVRNGCRSYECCGGRDCGYSLADAQQEIVRHYQRYADYFRELTPEEFLTAQGYHDQEID